jgi:hypothetical protein
MAWLAYEFARPRFDFRNAFCIRKSSESAVLHFVNHLIAALSENAQETTQTENTRRPGPILKSNARVGRAKAPQLRFRFEHGAST